MNIFGLNITRRPTLRRAADPSAWLQGDDGDPGEGAKLLLPYSQSAWIYVAVSVLAETVAQIPFRIARMPAASASDPPETLASWRQRALAENIVESGAVVDVFNHPHPSMDRALFWEMIMTWRCLRGEFFILPLDAQDQPVDIAAASVSARAGSGPGPIRRLLTLSPDQFWHIVQGYDLAGWRFTGAPLSSPISSQVLLPTELVHSRSPNPYLYWRGMSPLAVAMLPAASDYAAEQFMKGLMMNNADTGVIVTTKKAVSPEQRQMTIAALNERKRKAGTADRPIFLTEGATITKPAVSSADMQFLENRKLNRQEIGAIFKVPETMMGFSEQKHALGGGSSIEQDRLTFIQGAVTSHCRRLEAALAPIIKTFGHDLVGFFDIDSLPLMQEARRARVDAAAKVFAMGVPFNDINQIYDLGFKHLPWGDEGYLASNLQPAVKDQQLISKPPGKDQ